MDDIIVLTGKKAKSTLDGILAEAEGTPYPAPYVTGYFKEKGPRPEIEYVAFDNTTRDCWVEEFETAEEAAAWCRGEIEAPSLRS